MVAAMVLAHLVGDFVLQTDRLAAWKSRSLAGVTAHAAVVAVVTLVAASLVEPTWIFWAGVIALSHWFIDAMHFWLVKRTVVSAVPPLVRFLLDQVVHFTVLALILGVSGRLADPWLWQTTNRWLMTNPWTWVGYVLITMPTWVFIEFALPALVPAAPPPFSDSADKYTAMLERGLVVTFVLLGQLLLACCIVLPRWLIAMPTVRQQGNVMAYSMRLLLSFTIALAVGLLLTAF